MPGPHIQQIKLRRRSRLLEVSFDDGSCYELPFEYLRVYSPSAEVQGHGPGEGVLVVGKEQVDIRAIEPVGHYAVRLIFDDGHDSGLYTWKYLHVLGAERAGKWNDYDAGNTLDTAHRSPVRQSPADEDGQTGHGGTD